MFWLLTARVNRTIELKVYPNFTEHKLYSHIIELNGYTYNIELKIYAHIVEIEINTHLITSSKCMWNPLGLNICVSELHVEPFGAQYRRQ